MTVGTLVPCRIESYIATWYPRLYQSDIFRMLMAGPRIEFVVFEDTGQLRHSQLHKYAMIHTHGIDDVERVVK